MVTSHTNMSKRENKSIPHRSSKRQKNLVSAGTQPTRTHGATEQAYDEAVLWEVMMELLKEVPLRVVPRGTELWYGGHYILTEMPKLPFYGIPCDWTIRFGAVSAKLQLVRDANILDIRTRHKMRSVDEVNNDNPGADAKLNLILIIKRIVSESTIADDEEKAKWGKIKLRDLNDIILMMPLIDGWLADKLAPSWNTERHIDEMLIASERLVKINYTGRVSIENMESSRFFSNTDSYQDPTIGNPPPTLEEIERFEELEQEAIKARKKSMKDFMRVYEGNRSKLQQLAIHLHVDKWNGSYHILTKLWRTLMKRNRWIHKDGPALTVSEKTEYNMLLCKAFNKMYPEAPYRANMWKEQPEEEYVDEEMPEDDDEEEYSDDDY